MDHRRHHRPRTMTAFAISKTFSGGELTLRGATLNAVGRSTIRLDLEREQPDPLSASSSRISLHEYLSGPQSPGNLHQDELPAVSPMPSRSLLARLPWAQALWTGTSLSADSVHVPQTMQTPRNPRMISAFLLFLRSLHTKRSWSAVRSSLARFSKNKTSHKEGETGR